MAFFAFFLRFHCKVDGTTALVVATEKRSTGLLLVVWEAEKAALAAHTCAERFEIFMHVAMLCRSASWMNSGVAPWAVRPLKAVVAVSLRMVKTLGESVRTQFVVVICRVRTERGGANAPRRARRAVFPARHRRHCFTANAHAWLLCAEGPAGWKKRWRGAQQAVVRMFGVI